MEPGQSLPPHLHHFFQPTTQGPSPGPCFMISVRPPISGLSPES